MPKGILIRSYLLGDLFKSKKYSNVSSRVKNDTEQRVIQRRNTNEGFKNAAISSLNIDKTLKDHNTNRVGPGAYSNTRTNSFQAPKLEYDIADLESKTP